MRFPFRNRRSRARDEALVWLARLKRGLRQAEGPQLLAWLKRRSHRMAIAKAAAEWHGPEVLAVLSAIFPIPARILEPRGASRPALLIAASVAGACLAMGILIAILLATGVHRYVYATAPGAVRRLTLEDGTRVALNRGTQIEVSYAEHIRSVRLTQGEALLEVRSRPDSPFYIHAAGRNFETRAATVDVRFTAPGRMSLMVLKGTVKVLPLFAKPPGYRHDRVFNAKITQPILLEPLQMLVIRPDEESGQALTQPQARSRLSWQRGV